MKLIRTRPGDVIIIGDGIQVKVVRTAHDRVTIGITAPKDVTILRGELAPRSNHAPKGDETDGARPRAGSEQASGDTGVNPE